MSQHSTFRGVATINLFAADHAAAQQWYTDILGVEPYFFRPGYVEFRIGDDQTELGIIDSRYAQGLNTTSAPAGAVVYWHVEDLSGTLDRLLAKGATLLDGLRERGAGFVTASVVDPFGNVLGIMTNPHYVETHSNRD